VSAEEPMSIEELVRTATRAGATLVRDIRPLAAPEPARLRHRPAPKTRRWLSWGVPLAAAAAVALVAVGLAAVRGADSGAPATHPPATTAPTTVPRYYVALVDGTASPFRALLVGDDQTGKTIATVEAPPGLGFVSVQASSDDRTFAVMLEDQTTPAASPAETWYLLRIAPHAARPYQLTRLPINLPSSSRLASAYALSPDGRELAVESVAGVGDQNGGNRTTIGVYSVSSGARLRSWSTSQNITASTVRLTLSWVPGGRRLAFTATSPGGPQENQLRTLDLTASGTDLMAGSRALLTVRIPGSNPSTCWMMQLAPDGGTVVCGTQFAVFNGPTDNAGCANGGLEFTAYSVATGQPERVLYRFQTRGTCVDGLADPLWTGPSGSPMVGATEINIGSQGGKQVDQIGVITDGRIRLLKLPSSVSPAFYGIVAF
jgi:hypothetical protein